MHRFALVFLVSSSLFVAAAQATTQVSRHSRKHGLDALVGAPSMGSQKTKLRAGVAEAVALTARTSGAVSAIRVYLRSSSHVARLFVGFYSNRNGRPYRRLATGSVYSPQGGSWAQVKLRSVVIRRHTAYWLSVLGQGGTLYLRNARTKCTSIRAPRKSLPARWTGGRTSPRCRVSIYGIGTVGAPVHSVNNPRPVSGPTPPGTLAPLPGTRTTNCFASPGACGYPDPNYGGGNVGQPNCTSLTTLTPSNLSSVLPAGSYYYKGSGNLLEVMSSNTTWSHLNLANWQIYVGSGNNGFTLNDDCVSFTGDDKADQWIINASPITDFTLENSTVYSTSASSEANAIESSAGTTISNDYIYNTNDAINIGSNSTVENSYIDTNSVVSGAHSEPLWMKDATILINHNTLLNPQTQTADIFAEYGAANCDNHLAITNNLLAGGGYVLYACSGNGGQGTSTLDFEDNDIARCLGTPHSSSDGGSYCGSSDPSPSGTSIGYGADTHGYWPNGGHFGVDAFTYCGGSGVTWSGNFWDNDASTLACKQ